MKNLSILRPWSNSFSLIILFFSIFMLASSGALQAQCSAPTSLETTVTASTCASNGTIVALATGGVGLSLEYSLYNAANTVQVRPWQTSPVFNDLAPNTYTVRARYVCLLGGYSDEYSMSATVGGSYTPPSISALTVQRRAQCNNGRISATSAGGTSPKTYALVSSLTAAEPATYVRPPQSSGVFDSLAAGTHYVRVYDACGNYATSSVTVASFTQTNPYDYFRIYYWLCDSLSGTVYLANLSDYVAGTTDTSRRLWITYPDGSTDTLDHPGVSTTGSVSRSFKLPMSKLGTVGTGSFPNNIGGTWPKYFQIGFKDACGNVFTKTDSLIKPVLTVQFAANTSLTNCDSSYYRFLVTSGTAPGRLYDVYLNNNASFSTNGGSTWQPVTAAANTRYSQNIAFASGSGYNVCFAYCGDTTCFTGTIPSLSTFNASVSEQTQVSCVGNSGIYFRPAGGAVMPVTVEMLSGPAGVAFLPDTLTANVFSFTRSSRNLVPGTYIFRLVDGCGRIDEDTITLVHPYQLFDVNYSFPCGSTSMQLKFTNDTFWNNTASAHLYAYARTLKAQIYKADSTLAISTVFFNAAGSATITIPSATITSLANGNYFIRAWKDGADSCAFIDLPWEKNASFISLSNSLAVAACPGDPSTGTVVAIAQGGNGMYSYSLYEDSVSTGTLVAGPQTDNIFNGLDADKTYVVTVSDTCGRGTQANMSFGSTPLPVYSNADGMMPCPGDTLKLRVNNIPGAEYQWFKNGTPISGATSYRLEVAGIETSDSGEYKVELTLGSCEIFLSSFLLDPNECGTPLTVSLVTFTAKKVNQTSLLEWVTASEKNNKGFEIERSADGANWVSIGFTGSKATDGNSAAILEYSFIDQRPLPGVNYYRLHQMDYDGASAYSEIRRVAFDNSNAIVVFPNPTKDILYISGLNGGEQVTISNIIGQHVFKGEALAGTYQASVAALPAGIYTATIIANDGTIVTHKFTKK